MKVSYYNCPQCGLLQECEAQSDGTRNCSKCGADLNGYAQVVEDWAGVMVKFGGVLLFLGLIGLVIFWIMGNGQGMIGSGFLGVIGAILSRKNSG